MNIHIVYTHTRRLATVQRHYIHVFRARSKLPVRSHLDPQRRMLLFLSAWLSVQEIRVTFPTS
jgi:hypothetical protein